MLLVVMSPPTVLSVIKCSWGAELRLAYASVSIIEKHDPNTMRKSPEVSIRFALVENLF